MKILVTGGAGFIGTNLIEKLLLEKNNEITSLDCYFSGTEKNHLKGVRYINGYTWDIFKIFKNEKFDTIFHFGEYSRIVNSFDDIEFVSESILNGTPKVLNYVLKCKAKLIYSASSSKFGNMGKDENLSPYAWMKAKMVELIKNYNSWFNLQFEITYFFNVYGPRQVYEGKYSTVVAIFERQFLNNEKCSVVSPGTQTRDFTYVGDIVNGILEVINVNKNYEWHFRTGLNTSIIDLAEMFGDWELVNERKGERFESEYFESDTENLLNWRPTHKLSEWVKNKKLYQNKNWK